jgi:DNA-binding PadR family transcriptional regulator
MAVRSPTLASGSAVRFALLALLAQGETHGYELKLRFERSTGGLWPLNVGQVYDALRRLERAGLVIPAPDVDDERRPYALTRRGRAVCEEWLAAAADAGAPPRDELAIKLMVAHAAGIGAFADLVQHHREASMSRLQGLARRKADAVAESGDGPEVWLVDLLLLRAQADVKWLDLIEARAGRAQGGAA